MIVVNMITTVVVLAASFWAFYILIIPLVAFVYSGFGSRTTHTTIMAKQPRIAVLVPAHNMERYISRCIDSITACAYPIDQIDVYVTADHCTDNTTALAAGSGAIVLERELEPRGKTYALAWTIEMLKGIGKTYDLFVIVDATARVDHGFLDGLVTRWADGAPIIVGHPIVDPDNVQWFARCLGLTLAHRNLQNWSRDVVGLSGFIGGRGMAYDKSYVERFGWSLALPTVEHGSSHPTEDWRHGVRVVEHGYKVAFAHGAKLYTPLQETLEAATEQGVRWERGRLINMASHGSALFLRGVKELDPLKIFAGLDAVQPPVAVLAGVSAIVASASILAPTWFVTPGLGMVPLTLIALYSLSVVAQGRMDGIKTRTILWAPIYIAWRCVAFVRALLSLGRSAVLSRIS